MSASPRAPDAICGKGRCARPSTGSVAIGPVCESGDWLGRDRYLAVEEGDLLAILSAGAYGFVMASNYNTRPKPAEIMVDGKNAYVIRAREKTTDLYTSESVLPK